MVASPFGRYGLGLWRFTSESVDDASRLIAAAVDVGITLLDNAAVYGRNWGGKGFGAAEELLGAVLARTPALRDKVCVATKGGITPGIPYDQSPATLRRECEDSLRRLRLERIDLYCCNEIRTSTNEADIQKSHGDFEIHFCDIADLCPRTN